MGVSPGDQAPASARLEPKTLKRGSRRLHSSQATPLGLLLRDGLGTPICSREPARLRVIVRPTRVTQHLQDLSRS